jgi:phosphoribosylformimino-5-aminoimidazole carboxamide ribotide isomerase
MTAGRRASALRWPELGTRRTASCLPAAHGRLCIRPALPLSLAPSPTGPAQPMILYPAIDLKDGQCVRLLRGDMEAATVFGDDPAAQARAFADAGCRWLHLVDLNGAFAGHPVNAEAVEAIRAAVNIPAQLGGGIRDMATIERWLDRGLARVILGTVAVRDPGLVRAAARAFPDRVAVGIDARAGRVAVAGWAEETDLDATELARRFEDAGVAALIYTDIDRDGALGGPNTAATAALARAVSIPVIASGGVASLDDLRALKATGVIAGVISGRALYEGRLDLGEALTLLEAGA